MDPVLSISYTTLADFLEAAEGNYRNALFIRCTCCHFQQPPRCGGFLFIPGSDCRPLLVPLRDAEIFLGRRVDPQECADIINNITFRRLYHQWFLLNTSSDEECPLHQMLSVMNRPHKMEKSGVLP